MDIRKWNGGDRCRTGNERRLRANTSSRILALKPSKTLYFSRSFLCVFLRSRKESRPNGAALLGIERKENMMIQKDLRKCLKG